MVLRIGSSILLLCCASGLILLYSYHHPSTVYDFAVNTPPHPIILTNPNLNPFNFTFTIKLLAFDRLPSISRCLKSLADADYGADRVNLHIYIDHFNIGDGGRAIRDQKLDISHHILDFVDGFKWNHGEKIVHYRTDNLGLQGQWLEAWWPDSLNDFAFLVEDDLEVSPLFYRFLRSVVFNFYYDDSNFSPFVYGVSLQRPRFVAGKHGNKMDLDNGTGLFLYQLVGTWGQLLFPKPWKEFRLWYDNHKSRGVKPLLDGMVTTGWYRKMGERIWTPWFIKFLHSHHYFNIYTLFPNHTALSTSHREPGVNYRTSVGPDSALFDPKSAGFDRFIFPPLTALKWFDFCFRQVRPPASRPLGPPDLDVAISSLQKNRTLVVLAVSAAAPEQVVRNLICHFENTGLDNFLLLGRGLGRFSSRGYPVAEPDLFPKNLNFENGDLSAHVVTRCLEKGYSVLVLRGDSVPVGDLWFFENGGDFYVGEETGSLFVRGSERARRVWAVGLRDGRKGEEDGFLGFVRGVVERGGGRVESFEKEGVVLRIDDGGGAGLKDEKFVFWSPVGAEGVDLVKGRLEKLGLWLLDEDGDSCRGVYCRKAPG